MTFSGIVNLGNSCYLNAVLQCIAHSPPLRSAVAADAEAHGEDGFAAMLRTLLDTLMAQTCTVRPRTFVQSVLDDPKAGFARHVPEDAHEFFTYVVDRVHEETARPVTVRSAAGSDLERASIGGFKAQCEKRCSRLLLTAFGQLCTSIRGVEGECRRDVFETFSTLTVPVPQADCTLHDCLDAVFAEELLDGDNKFHDDVAGEYVPARRRQQLWRVPKTLVVTLGRFGHQKNTSRVSLPRTLDVRRYVNPEAAEGETTYELTAVCYHAGDSHGGHCYAGCRVGDEWYTFDDTAVYRRGDAGFDDDAYLLFYSQGV